MNAKQKNQLKQQKRRAALDEVAKACGFSSHYKMMTAISKLTEDNHLKLKGVLNPD